ncbi:MAG TPA: carbamate kinase [Coriobacteriia bacterium]|nr:carbamate kinase [Coriobacteriia bacterium]
MTSSRVAVIAVGGNALIMDPEHQSAADQFRSVEGSMQGVVDLICDGWTVVLTHGNGPQVGLVLRRSELSAPEIPPLPMDYADADTQGMLGYMFQRAMGNELRRRGTPSRAVTVLTQVVVSVDDPAMVHPSKPVGSFLTQEQAEEIHARDGWSIAEDAGRGWRRVVPSPYPREIVEIEAIKTLVAAGHVVVACGGGGIPVVREGDALCGTWAVIDKDLTASLLARELKADLLAILTGVDRVATGFGTPAQEWLDTVSAADLRAAHDVGEFPAGSMEPKVRAVLEFLDAGGPRAIITDKDHLVEAVAGRAGTTITP